MDERQLALHTNVNAQNATTTTTALPSSAAGTGVLCHIFYGYSVLIPSDLGIHMVNVVEPNLPSQAVLSVLNAA